MVQDERQGLHVGGVQPLVGGEAVHHPVDLAEGAAQRHGEPLEPDVVPARRRSGGAGRLPLFLLLLCTGHPGSLYSGAGRGPRPALRRAGGRQ
ncbi:hypothetical protein GCM10010305_40290 [Streptomyces termitum]|uniref:Uncharacterized protein n=1 Tax=Streptomyces termitum TaxID=67368 RepID=A0A918WB66_9ACTN|nr:hypothetical protein GCM10010305_40290 [Streptomyces termitum]